MSEHHATVRWELTTESFEPKQYNRHHKWYFDGGVEVPASAAPAYGGAPEDVDPEEAFVASLASCHMLTFLALAAKKKFVVKNYVDDAIGELGKNDDGRMMVLRVLLKPAIVFDEAHQPDSEELAHLHAQAHEHCFIANSVLTRVVIEIPS